MSALLFDQAMVQLSRCNCAECGLVFGLPDNFKQERRDDHRIFYCPNGHTNYYPQKSEAEQAREEAERMRRLAVWQRERAEGLLANLTSERHKVAAERGAKTKLKKKLHRVNHGVCPCCQRSFQNLRRHMATKHPAEVVKQ